MPYLLVNVLKIWAVQAGFKEVPVDGASGKLYSYEWTPNHLVGFAGGSVEANNKVVGNCANEGLPNEASETNT